MPLEHRLHARCGCASIGSAEHAFGRSPLRPTPIGHSDISSRTALFPSRISRSTSRSTCRARSIRATAVLGADVRRVDPSADQLELDAIAFEVHEVALDGQPANAFSTTGGRCASRSRVPSRRPASPSPTARRRVAVSTFSSRTSTTPIVPDRCGRNARKKTLATGSRATTVRTRR